jgi:hypothetical protein
MQSFGLQQSKVERGDLHRVTAVRREAIGGKMDELRLYYLSKG